MIRECARAICDAIAIPCVQKDLACRTLGVTYVISTSRLGLSNININGEIGHGPNLLYSGCPATTLPGERDREKIEAWF